MLINLYDVELVSELFPNNLVFKVIELPLFTSLKSAIGCEGAAQKKRYDGAL